MTRYFRPSLAMPEIYRYRQPVDFRKARLDSPLLSSKRLGRNPFDGALYAFTNRRYKRIKCVFWEDNGFVLYYKALAEEKFRWPKGNEVILSLTRQQINWVLDGYDLSQMKGHKKLHYESVF